MPASLQSSTEKILVRGVNWLGDAILTTPALLRLREAKPKARIALLTPEKLAGLWQSQPFIDDVLTFSDSESVLQIGRRLRKEQFTAAVAFPNSIRSALELWLAGIPRRTGYARNGRGILLTEAIGPRLGAVVMRKRSPDEVRRFIREDKAGSTLPPSAHHVHDYLHLVAALGASPDVLPPKIFVSAESICGVQGRFGVGLTDQKGPWFGLNAGAEYGPAKRWPPERFIAAAIELHRKTGCRWVVLGGAAETALAGQITGELQKVLSQDCILNVCGRTSLTEFGAVLKLCRLVLTNDTGPMHLAAAVGAPVVAVFGSTSPELTGPVYSPEARILRGKAACAPCFQRECAIDFRCMTTIAPEAAVEAGLGLYAKKV